MVKKRLIATLLCHNGIIVQSINFKHTNAIGNAQTAVDFFSTWSVDEIVILDVSYDTEMREEFHETIKTVSKRCFVPLSVGGWIRDVAEIRTLLASGADKVVVNTALRDDPEFVSKAAAVFGSQCIVASMDVRGETPETYEVFVERGRRGIGVGPVEWARHAEGLGAGEIYLTSVERDGSRLGYDLALTRMVSEAVGVPVIASGGVGNWDHLAEGVLSGHAEAVSAANIFHFTEHSTKKAKEAVAEAGVDVPPTFFHKNLRSRKPTYDPVFSFKDRS